MTYPPAPWGPVPPDPEAPFGRDPYGTPYSDKSKVTAGLLQLLLTFFCGLAGIGRLYAGHTGIGLLQLLGVIVSIPLMLVLVGFVTLAGFVIWGIVDGIMMLAGRPVDGRGRPLRP